jgi:hypothetical protein
VSGLLSAKEQTKQSEACNRVVAVEGIARLPQWENAIEGMRQIRNAINIDFEQSCDLSSQHMTTD